MAAAQSIQFLADITLSKLAADPTSPATGDMYFNTGTKKLRTFNGSTWDEMGAGGAATPTLAVFNAQNFY